ncbi:dihydrofolate reductase family protein [Spongiactinospora sp. TRM90649]|uniref:dihydrofolate reductase family protein n=1 Tax=Spongiactinospora sp. TRM90649 TaxID=3031114 RepID=UPI0023F938FE|nr:dihydrofolate reductase family protein [Spongiactinospora sp. TRM90649]MDF5754495.1 dihydrofolate reductase family protein [Spongiactinospora sp. TRM90649]
MRKIIAQLFVSVDGVMEAPEDWHFPYYDDQMGEVVAEQFHQADTLLLGRATYEVFAASWPQRGDEVPLAKRINAMPKLVASTTLDTVHWHNSTLIVGDVATELTKLKEGPGDNITISGSPTLVRSLLRENVLDELQLLVHPIVLGHGGRLFADDGRRTPLRLVDSVTFGTGVLHLTYRPADDS